MYLIAYGRQTKPAIGALGGSPGRDVDAGPGRAGAPGAGHSRQFGAAGGGEIHRGGQDLATRPSSSCPRPPSRRCSSAARRRWRQSPAQSPMRGCGVNAAPAADSTPSKGPRSGRMPLEVHPLMQDSDDDDPALGSPGKTDVRADRELAIAGTDVVAGKSRAGLPRRFRRRGEVRADTPPPFQIRTARTDNPRSLRCRAGPWA